ncbi:MerR family transcriptional regulator [Actinomadura viridis]|uniref:MerR family transcriptional regulator n=1 Tax=Actinomadura viridis TaxID=58110 RepID=UPI00368D967F
MKISELGERSGLTIQTIKFYIREGLLPKGTATGATRAEYDERHLDRLRLVRALREVGDLPVAAIRRIVAAVDDDAGMHRLFGITQYAIGPHVDPPDQDPGAPEDLAAQWRTARQDVDALMGELGWRVTARAPARDLLAQTFVALRRLGFPVTLADLLPYTRAAAAVAEHEIGMVAADAPRTRAVHAMLVSTVLYEQVLTALHRLAQEDASARRFGSDDPGGMN